MTPSAASKIASPRGTPGHELPFEDRPDDDQRQELEEHEPTANVGLESGTRRLRDADKEPGAAALGPPLRDPPPLLTSRLETYLRRRARTRICVNGSLNALATRRDVASTDAECAEPHEKKNITGRERRESLQGRPEKSDGAIAPLALSPSG